LEQIQHWWLDRLRLPTGCLRKAIGNRPSLASRKRKGHVLPYGTARLSIHSTSIVQSIYGAIQEYAGSTGRSGSICEWAVWDSNPEPRD